MSTEKGVLSFRKHQDLLIGKFLVQHLNDYQQADMLRQQLLASAQDWKFSTLILDGEKLVYLISEALGILAQTNTQLKGTGQKMALCRLEPEVIEGYEDGRHPTAVRFTTAREDVLRRDFTINGMLFDPDTDDVIDWVGGQEDIRKRTIRTIGNPLERFEEDKLRMLRAIRFAARFEYAIEENTYHAIEKTANKLNEVSQERIREELSRILTGPRAGRALRLMHDLGLLAPILPEIEALVGVEQPPQFHPEGDVFEHTCIMLDLSREPSIELAFAVLLHDVGKPGTQTFAERIRFDEHDKAGEEISRVICNRLRFSNDQTAHIVSLVGNHMRFAAVQRMKLSTLKRLLALPKFHEHLELHRLDCASSHGKLDNYEFLQQKLEELSQEEIAPAPLITGRDLIDMGFQPGPQFAEILSAVREEQLEGNLGDRGEALSWVGNKYKPT